MNAWQRSLMRSLCLLALAGGVLLLPQVSAAQFTEVSQSLGINIFSTGDRSDWGHGAAFCDIDGDGILELYVSTRQANSLFKFDPATRTFVDLAPVLGCSDPSNGRAVLWADYDNDGDPDCFVSNYLAPNRLFQNDGNGSFTDVAPQAGVDHVGKSHSAAWADYDNDGFLDLFVCSYGTSARPSPNQLYHSLGDGTFEEVGASVGVADEGKPALACAWLDYDNDNDPDLYVAYDKLRGNELFRNNGDGTFTPVGMVSNTDAQMNAMGVAVADYDFNGYLDMYVSNTPEGHELFHNNGDGTFSRVAVTLGVQVNRIGWGTAFLDYDNDGDDDLYVVHFLMNGGANAANVLFRNNGDGTFTDVTAAERVGDEGPGFAMTVGDYNNDGFPDIFVNNQHALGSFRSVVYENTPNGNKWLKLRTVGTVSNRDGIGAKIRLTSSNVTQLKDVRSGSSYLSALSRDVEFGLGRVGTVDRIEISWPSGIIDTLTDVSPNQLLVVYEGGKTPPGGDAPSSLVLHHNVPNPFNPATTIRYELPSEGRVRLEIFGARGGRVRTLVDSHQSAGAQEAVWDGRNSQGERMATGIYFYRLDVDGKALTRKMLLLK